MRYLDRLRLYAAKGPEAIKEPWTEVPAAEFAELVSAHFHPLLDAQGFERVDPARWVRSRFREARDVVEIVALRGASYSAVWGFSLDFVPTIRDGAKWNWHRTPKSARCDLVYDPFDYAVNASEWSVTRLESRVDLPGAVVEWAGRVAPAALEFFRPVDSLEDLETAFRAKEARKYVRLGPQNYPQHYLAHAFLLARLDRCDEARAMFSRYLERDPMNSEILSRAREAMGI